MSLSATYSYANPLNLTSEVPNEVVPQSSSKLIQSTSKQVSITCTGANSANAGGFLTFQLPSGSGAGWLKTKSIGFQFTVTPTTAGAAPDWAFNTRNATSVINRLTVSVGSQQIEQIQNYAQFSSILYTHCGSNDYSTHDATILEKHSATLASGTPITAIVPLFSGLLNSDKYIPLWLMSAPIQIMIDFNTATAAFATTAVTGYTVTNPKLLFEVVNMDPSYDNSIRQAMAESGQAFSIYMNSVLSAQTSQALGATLSFNSGLSLSSLNGILCASILTADMASGTAVKYFVQNGATQYRWFIDGQQYPQYPITCDANDQTLPFYSLQNTVGNVFDTTITSESDLTTYPTADFVTGVGLRRSLDNALTHVGIPATQAITEIVGATAAATVFIFYLYSAQVLVDGNGSVMVLK